MKRCPVCCLTYRDEIQFCPADGTKLVYKAEASGFYKGQIIAEKYEIREEIELKSCWASYKAYEKDTGRIVIVKIVNADEFDFSDRVKYKDYLKKVKLFKHPGLIELIDYGISSNDVFYIVLEYIEGENLQKIIDDLGALSIPLCLFVIEQTLEILEAIYSFGLCNLDLRPSKIFVCKNSSGENYIKLSISEKYKYHKNKQADKNQFSYVPPEVFSADKLDIRSDIYSLGIIFFRMLAGVFPYPQGLNLKHFDRQHYPLPPPIKRVKPYLKISYGIEKTILKAIQWLPEKRFETPQDFKLALKTKKYRNKIVNAKFIVILVLLTFIALFIDKEFVYNYIEHKEDKTKRTNIKPNREIKKIIKKQEEDNFLKKVLKYKNLSKKAPKNIINNKMCYIPEGKVVIGNNKGELDERPARIINVSGYYIDKTEVTNAQYQLFINHTGHTIPKDWAEGKYPPDKSNYPVVFVTWYDATLYSIWCNKALPSEIQWEKAAHGAGNLKKLESLNFCWGNSFKKGYANIYNDESYPVGTFSNSKSPYGVLDMPGNVWEWTDSWYDVEIKEDRVIKGGSFISTANEARTTYRTGFIPSCCRNDIGFRCIKELK